MFFLFPKRQIYWGIQPYQNFYSLLYGGHLFHEALRIPNLKQKEKVEVYNKLDKIDLGIFSNNPLKRIRVISQDVY